jgi:septal ring factor EnvC (AmiA/AmiB activator)
MPKKSPNFDSSSYERTIDSLNNVIENNKKVRDSLILVGEERENKIKEIRKEINKLKYKSLEYEKKYKEQVDIINRMSNDDVIRTFTDTFN